MDEPSSAVTLTPEQLVSKGIAPVLPNYIQPRVERLQVEAVGPAAQDVATQGGKRSKTRDKKVGPP
jgi:hypothetical protein